MTQRPSFHRPMIAAAALAVAAPAHAAHIIDLGKPDAPTSERSPAEPAPAPSAPPTDGGSDPIRSYSAAMLDHGLQGPRQIPIEGRAALALPSNTIFVGQPALNAAFEGQGDPVWPGVVGMVTSEDGPSAFRAVISTASDGAIKAEAALTAGPDEWLSRLRRGRQATNGALLDHGFGAVMFVAWRTPPTYDAKRHTLDWSVVERDFDGAETLCRHHAQLDRDGYVAIDFFTDLGKAAETDKIASALFTGLSSDADHAYAAFNAAKDPSAPYGLADLIAGAELKAPQFPALAPSTSPSRAPSQSEGAAAPAEGGFRGGGGLRYGALLGVGIAGLRLLTSKRGVLVKSLFILVMASGVMRFLGVI